MNSESKDDLLLSKARHGDPDSANELLLPWCPGRKRGDVALTENPLCVRLFPIILVHFSKQENSVLTNLPQKLQILEFLFCFVLVFSDTGESSQRIIERALDLLHQGPGTIP